MRRKAILLTPLLLTCLISFSQTWSQLGPDGGFFKEFAIDPINSNIVYAGSDDGGGVWKTTDGGNTWTLLTSNFPNFTGWHIEIDENNPQTVYASELYGRYGVLKTTDGGNSWVDLQNGLNTFARKQVSKLAIASVGGDTLLISTGEGDDPNNAARPGDGVFKSINGGATWFPSGFQGSPVPCIEFTDGILFAGTHKQGLHFSSDYGQNWFLHPQISDTAVVHQIEAIDSVIVVATDFGIFLSTDYGTNFTNIGLINDFNFEVDIFRTTPSIEIITTTFSGPQIYHVSTATWTAYSSPLLVNQLIIGMASNGNDIYFGLFSSTPIVKSTDGGTTWNRLSKNPISTETPNVIAISGSSTIYTTLQNSYSASGIYNNETIAKTTDGGTTWTRTGPIGHGLDLVLHPTDTSILYMATFAQGVFKTTNGFSSWTNPRIGNKLIFDIEIDENKPSTILISEYDFISTISGIYKSTDSGVTWSSSSAMSPNKIAITNWSDTCYAATSNGIYLSTDVGTTWGTVPFLLAGENILEITINNGFLYAGTEGGKLYQITGTTIIDISGNWTIPVEVKNIYFVNSDLLVGLNGAEQDTTNILVGSIWKTPDNGNSWTDISGDLTNTNNFGPSGISYNNGNLYVATYGGGVYSANSVILGISENPLLAVNFKLFPNPTSTESILEFENSKNEVHNLVLFDSQGKIVQTIYNIKGNHLPIEFKELTKGIYFFKLNSYKGTVASGKIITK